MRLYPKRLRNLEDLEREKKLVIRESKQLDKEEFLSLNSLTGKKNKKQKDSSDEEGSLIDLMPVSNPLIKLGLKILLRRFTRDNRKYTTEYSSASSKRENPIRRLAFEFIGGYLKWKAIEMSCKGIKYLINKRKESKSTS